MCYVCTYPSVVRALSERIAYNVTTTENTSVYYNSSRLPVQLRVNVCDASRVFYVHCNVIGYRELCYFPLESRGTPAALNQTGGADLKYDIVGTSLVHC